MAGSDQGQWTRPRALGLREASLRGPGMTQTKGFLSPGLSHSAPKPLIYMVGPPGLFATRCAATFSRITV